MIGIILVCMSSLMDGRQHTNERDEAQLSATLQIRSPSSRRNYYRALVGAPPIQPFCWRRSWVCNPSGGFDVAAHDRNDVVLKRQIVSLKYLSDTNNKSAGRINCFCISGVLCFDLMFRTDNELSGVTLLLNHCPSFVMFSFDGALLR